jgi:putative heme-binding domain-containing protein
MKLFIIGVLILVSSLVAAPSGLDSIVQLIGQVDEPAFQADLLKGMREGLTGQKNVSPPKGWAELSDKLVRSPNETVREEARALGLIFGDSSALDALRKTLVSKSVNITERRKALKILVEKQAPGLAPSLQELLNEKELRADALRGLAAYNDPKTPGVILKVYPSLTTTEKQIATNALASRKNYAGALLRALSDGQINRRDISVPIARQIQSLGDKDLSALLKKHWGEIRPIAADKAKRIKGYKAFLTKAFLAKADLPNGRALFNNTCGACHILYGVGGRIGPDITGSDRRNLDYVLDNVLDPNGAIGNDYRFTTISMKDGRVVAGMVTSENKRSLTMQTVTERIVLSKEDVTKRQVLPISMMPEGLFDALKKEEIRDLIAYLATNNQVGLPKNE